MRCDLPVGHKGCYLQNTAVDGAGCGQHRAQTASRALYTAFHRQIRHLFKYMKAQKKFVNIIHVHYSIKNVPINSTYSKSEYLSLMFGQHLLFCEDFSCLWRPVPVWTWSLAVWGQLFPGPWPDPPARTQPPSSLRSYPTPTAGEAASELTPGHSAWYRAPREVSSWLLLLGPDK